MLVSVSCNLYIYMYIIIYFHAVLGFNESYITIINEGGPSKSISIIGEYIPASQPPDEKIKEISIEIAVGGNATLSKL